MLRLSLKLLKAKNGKDDWKYPKTGQIDKPMIAWSPFEAATEILGKCLIDQCQWKISKWSSSGEKFNEDSENLESSGNLDVYTFKAVLARPDYSKRLLPT